MTRCRIAEGWEQPRLRALWQLCFGEAPDSVEPLFARLYRPGRGLALEEGGTIQSMLLSIPIELTSETGERLPAEYFYAFCTHPEARGRGYGRTLLAWAEERAAGRGRKAAVMVPGEERLFGFYARLGYRPAFPHRTERLDALPPAPAAEVARLDPAAYNALRERLLAGTAHAGYPPDYIEGQAELCRQSAGGLFSVALAGGTCLAAAEGREGDRLLLKELLAPDSAWKSAAAALCAHLGARACAARRPGQGGCFGVVKPLGGTPPEPCYFGLGLD